MEPIKRASIWLILATLAMGAGFWRPAPVSAAALRQGDQEQEEVEIEIEKAISEDNQTWLDADSFPARPKIVTGADLWWRITVRNVGTQAVNLTFSDSLDGEALDLATACETAPPATLAVDETFECIIQSAAGAPGPHANQVTVEATFEETTIIRSDWAYYLSIGEGEDDGDPTLQGEGCGQGYWKNHPAAWMGTGFTTEDDYETVFGIDAAFTLTLLETLQQGGGGEMALGRQAVAALLNAAHPEVDYELTTEEVIALVQAAYGEGGDIEGTKDTLETQNEQTCALGGPADPQHNQPGVRTRTHWQDHPEEWPVEELPVGHARYNKEQILAMMGGTEEATAAGAAASEQLFGEVVAARLNVAIGNDAGCVANTLAAADDWLAQYPVGSNLDSADPAWSEGAALAGMLESYNNGALCAPAQQQQAGNFSLFLPLLTRE